MGMYEKDRNLTTGVTCTPVYDGAQVVKRHRSNSAEVWADLR